jgi:hypothetical protein
LRQSFDDFCDRKAAHILSSFASDAALVLAHLDCDEKSNEHPNSQAPLRQPGLEQPCTVKKRFEEAAAAGAPLIAGQRQPAHVAPTRRTGVPNHSRRRPKRHLGHQAAIA